MLQVRNKAHARLHGFDITLIAALVAVIVNSSCFFDPRTTFCEASGLLCPPGWSCAAAQDVCIPAGGCGDGFKSPDELCDDGNILPGDSCSPDCQTDKPCGDGVVDPGEDCDDGIRGSKGCNKDCTFVECGDWKVNEIAGEECDSGGMNTPECNGKLCTAAVCGDGFYNPAADEQCDTGMEDTQACNGNNIVDDDVNCHMARCGDGHVNKNFAPAGPGKPKEVCDDGLDDDCGTCGKSCTENVELTMGEIKTPAATFIGKDMMFNEKFLIDAAVTKGFIYNTDSAGDVKIVVMESDSAEEVARKTALEISNQTNLKVSVGVNGDRVILTAKRMGRFKLNIQNDMDSGLNSHFSIKMTQEGDDAGNPCDPGDRCSLDADCQSSKCGSGVCQP
jgi:cysteine-rich repeat protein